MTKKIITPKRTDIFELATTIDGEFSFRENELKANLDELQIEKDRLAQEKAELELAKESLTKEKADFDLLRVEVDQKYAKIRSDEELTKALNLQADQVKEIDKKLKEVKESEGLTKYNLDEIAKRELALSQKEKIYEQEVAKKFVANIFKG